MIALTKGWEIQARLLIAAKLVQRFVYAPHTLEWIVTRRRMYGA